MKYKAGDKVRVLNKEDSDWFEDAKSMMGRICEIKGVSCGDYLVWNNDKSDSWRFNEDELAPVEKTLYTLEVGDVVVDEDYRERVVLEVLTQTCLLTYITTEEAYDWYTFKELEKKGYTLKSPQPTPLKMTVSEIAEKLGHEVEIIKE